MGVEIVQLSFDLVDWMWPDVLLDRHWDSTMLDIVDPAAAAAQVRAHGLADRPAFLEVFYPFEQPDAAVLHGVRRSVELLRPHFA